MHADDAPWLPMPGDRVRILTPFFGVPNLTGTVKATPRKHKLGSKCIYVAVPTDGHGEIWIPCHASELTPLLDGGHDAR